MKQITIKLILDNGSEITAYTDKSELAKLNEPQRPRTGYERVKGNELYYAISTNNIHSFYDGKDSFPLDMFNSGDYVNDKQLCQDRLRAKILFNKLEQWQALNDAPVDWGDTLPSKYWIVYDYACASFRVELCTYTRIIGGIYFSTRKKAEEAIEVFRDELIWYFTEYRSRLDEKRTKC